MKRKEKKEREGSVNRKELFDRVEGDLGLPEGRRGEKKKKKTGKAVSHGNGIVAPPLKLSTESIVTSGSS